MAVFRFMSAVVIHRGKAKRDRDRKSSGQKDTVERFHKNPIGLIKSRGTRDLAWQKLKAHTKNLEEKILSRQIVWSSVVALALAFALLLNVIFPSNSSLKSISDKASSKQPRASARKLASDPASDTNEAISIQPKLDQYFRN